MFGTGGFGQQPAFGAASAPATGFGSSFGSAFGQSQPAFGAASAPAFGAASTPGFGASPAPAFGAASAPAFGATSTPAFGAASAPAFGAAAQGAFGATSAFGAPKPATTFGSFGGTSAFGAPASQPAFGGGLAGAFGAQPATQSAFGVASAPAFGAASTGSVFGAASAPAFGAQPASPFGGTTAFGAQPASQPAFGGGGLFGAAAASSPAASPFGATAPTLGGGGLFGAAPAAAPGAGFGVPGAVGSRVAPYQKTLERDGTSTAGAQTTANFVTITAMPQYQQKSMEELRWEDYQAGVKHAGAAPAPTATPANPFGSPATAPTSPFGGLGAAPAPAFGSTAPAFGTPGTTPAFGAAGGGLFGAAQSQPTFGGGAFGAAPAASPFGGTTPPAFGAASAPAFGATGGGLFGAASAAAFGAPKPASAGAFSFATTPSVFGASSASAFGGASAPSLFSSTGAAPGGGLFGAAQSAASPFGAAFATPQPASSPFGGTSFAPKPATSAFGTPGLFGASTGSAFGGGLFQSSAPAGGLFASSAFPAASTSAPSLFAPSSTPSLFGGASSPSLFGQAAPGAGFGQTASSFALTPYGQAGVAAAPAAVPLSVAAAPYGAFPNLPTVPEPRVGISARPAPARTTSNAGGAGALRASPLVSLRATASGATNKVGAAAQVPPRHASMSPLGSLGVVSSDTGTTSAGATPMTGTPGGLRARPNPHQLFIREMPPSTQPSANGGAFSPARSPGPSNQTTQPTSHRPSSASPFNPFTPLSGHKSAAGRHEADGDPEHEAHRHGDGAGPSNGAANGRGNGGQQDDQHDRQDRAWGRHSGATPPGGGRTASRTAGADYSYLPKLGQLAAEGYWYEPSSTQLQAMQQTDPESLARVSNFTVGREGKGQIRWLKPVDVRGLALSSIVKIEHGEVFCYVQGDKPPVGQGLNTDAEITLLGVYKTDKATNAPVRDGPQLIKWEKKLRAMCASMGAKFVSYKAAGGVWKFEVEHFSRYGLQPDAEDDDEDEDAATDYDMVEAEEARGQRRPGQGEGLRPRALGLTAVEEDEGLLLLQDEVDDDEVDQQGMEEGEGLGEGEGGLLDQQAVMDAAGMDEDGAQAPLQHSLPTHLALPPSQMLLLRDTYFAPTARPTGAFMLPPPTSLPAGSTQPGGALALALPGAGTGASAMGGAGVAAAEGAAQGQVQGAAAARRPHLWRSAPSPISSARPLRPPTQAQAADQPLAIVPAGEPVVRPLLMGPGATSSPAAMRGEGCQHLLDAGLSLGLSFRVGWGPGGQLVIPGPPGLQLPSAVQPITLRRALVEGTYDSSSSSDRDTAVFRATATSTSTGTGSSAALTALRSHLRAMLHVHVRHSMPVGGTEQGIARAAPDAGPSTPSMTPDHVGAASQPSTPVTGGRGTQGLWLPQWQLQCSPEELPGLVGELVAAAQDPLQPGTEDAQGGAGSADEAAALQEMAGNAQWQADRTHEVETWRLLQVLFEAQPVGSQGALGTNSNNSSSNQDDGQDTAMDAATPRAPGSVTLNSSGHQFDMAVHRQSNFSAWLQRQVLPAMRAALPAAATPCEAVLQLLCAHHLVAAAAAAAATGDTRLASLIAAGGLHARLQAAAAQQLDVWSASGMLDKIDATRLLIYRLLAGQVANVLGSVAVDWRGALGLLLWYQATHATPGQQPSRSQAATRNQPGHTAAAVAAYADMLASGQRVPPPTPPYAQQQAGSSRSQAPRFAASSRPPVDLQFVLLQVWAAHQAALADVLQHNLDSQEEGGPATGGDVSMAVVNPLAVEVASPGSASQAVQPIPAELLIAAGHSSNPCTAALPWCLLSVLQALGVLQRVTDAALAETDVVSGQKQLGLQLDATMALVEQLLAAGDMCEWALYVALHLPDRADSNSNSSSGVVTAAAAGVCRNRVVREVLQCTAPEWAGHAWRETFLTQVLHIPEALLQCAKASWALEQHDLLAACSCHLAAGQWVAAHTLLAQQVAPSLIMQHRGAQLEPLLQQLAPHMEANPDWPYAGGMYLLYLQQVDSDDSSSGHPCSTDGTQAVVLLQQLAERIQEAHARVAGAVDAAAIVGPAFDGASSGAGARPAAAGGGGAGRQGSGRVLALPAATGGGASREGMSSGRGGVRGAGGVNGTTPLVLDASGVGVSLESQLVQLGALELMGRRVQAALMPVLAQQAGAGAAAGVAQGAVEGGPVDVPALLRACGLQSATRGAAVAAAAQQLSSHLLST